MSILMWIEVAALAGSGLLIRPIANRRIRRAQEICVVKHAQSFIEVAALGDET
jgi:hypothetical protein